MGQSKVNTTLCLFGFASKKCHGTRRLQLLHLTDDVNMAATFIQQLRISSD